MKHLSTMHWRSHLLRLKTVYPKKVRRRHEQLPYLSKTGFVT